MSTTKQKTIKLSSIKPNPENPRLIKDDKFYKLLESIKTFGEKMMPLRPIVIDENKIILGGNMRFKALKELGYKEVPADWIKAAKDLTEEQKKEFIIKDNVGFGSWDFDVLANEWDSDLLEGWGLDMEDFDMDFTEIEASEDDYEEPDNLKVDVVLGDLIEIGNHRLLCGDSTNVDDVEKLMNGKKADLSFTSPPYNAGKSELLSGNTHSGDNKYGQYNDNQSKNNYFNLLKDFTNNALIFSEYLICNIQSLSGNKIALIEYLYQYKDNFIDVAIWDKTHGPPAMAKNVMNSCWEYLFFISSKENASRAIPKANFRGNVSNIYRGTPNRKNEFSKIHAATFPIDLPEWALKFTKEKSIILDQFLGTGTTMVAAHQLNRKCYGMELDPTYCQVIIDRMTKLDPELKVKINGKAYEKKEELPF